jgi:glutaredoxin
MQKILSVVGLVIALFIATGAQADSSPYKVFDAPKDLLEEMKGITESFKDSKPIVLFQSPVCHFCDVARSDLNERGLKFVEIDVTKLVSQPYWGRVVEVTGIAGTPQFLVGDKLLLGYSPQKIIKELKSK